LEAVVESRGEALLERREKGRRKREAREVKELWVEVVEVLDP